MSYCLASLQRGDHPARDWRAIIVDRSQVDIQRVNGSAVLGETAAAARIVFAADVILAIEETS